MFCHVCQCYLLSSSLFAKFCIWVHSPPATQHPLIEWRNKEQGETEYLNTHMRQLQIWNIAGKSKARLNKVRLMTGEAKLNVTHAGQETFKLKQETNTAWDIQTWQRQKENKQRHNWLQRQGTEVPNRWRHAWRNRLRKNNENHY